MKIAAQEISQDEILKMFSSQAISFKFGCPTALHMNGSWERFVKSVKGALRAIHKEIVPKEEVLWTCFIEAEKIS